MINTDKVQNLIYKFGVTIGMLPGSFKNSLTYEEQLFAIDEYINKVVVPALTTNVEALQELQNLFLELQDYVNNYFDNLDIQEEINNKLDEMLENGQLQEIITEYLISSSVIVFNNVEEMQNAENLIDGSVVKTLGFYFINDNGNAYYKIREIINTDVIDNMTKFSLNNFNNLIAEYIKVNNCVTPEQFGAKGDGTTNDLNNLQKTFDFGGIINFNKNKTYCTNNTLNIKSNSLINMNYSTIKLISTNPTDILVIENKENVEIKNGFIYGVWKSGFQSNSFPILISASQNINITNLDITNNISDGIYCGYRWDFSETPTYITKNINIKDCKIHEVGRNGISIVSGDNVTIDNCTFTDITNNAPKSGIDIEPETGSNTPLHLKNVIISNCKFINSDNTQEATIAINIYDGLLVENGTLSIHDCLCQNTTIVHTRKAETNENKGIFVDINNISYDPVNQLWTILLRNTSPLFPVNINNINIKGTLMQNNDIIYYGAITIYSSTDAVDVGGVTINNINVMKEQNASNFTSIIQTQLASGIENLLKNINVGIINLPDFKSTNNNLIMLEKADNASLSCKTQNTKILSDNWQQPLRGYWNAVIPSIHDTFDYYVDVSRLKQGYHTIKVLSHSNSAINIKVDGTRVKFADSQSNKRAYLNISTQIDFLIYDGLLYWVSAPNNKNFWTPTYYAT